MFYIRVTCEGQKITVLNPDDIRIVQGSRDIYTASFSMDDEWAAKAVSAVFINEISGVREVCDLINNSCLIPPSVLDMYGPLYFGLLGINGKEIMPTLKRPRLWVCEGIKDLVVEEDAE